MIVCCAKFIISFVLDLVKLKTNDIEIQVCKSLSICFLYLIVVMSISECEMIEASEGEVDKDHNVEQ